jgi:hypothetical protein
MVCSLEADLSSIDPTELSNETKGAIDMLSEVQSSLEMVSLVNKNPAFGTNRWR